MLRLAHVIIAHQHLSQLIRLVDKVASWGPVCIHVDKKCDETYFSELKRRFDSYQGIRILRTHRVHWGHFSQVDATLSALSELFLTNEQFDYVKLISGQDYPIKGSAEILRFLEDNKGRSFIENFPLPNEGWEKNGGMDRLDYWYFRLGAKTLTFPPKTLMERKHTGRLLEPISKFPIEGIVVL